ncbi:TolC family protein [Thiohalorhabdus sp.]|uniref:TolC family protein n=1 Tax=Thiohalorhabdus sp. TaxID=3094134 RepID=UPI002FC37374
MDRKQGTLTKERLRMGRPGGYRRTLVVLVALAGFIGVANAAPPELPESGLTIDQAVRIGLANHPGLVEARAKLDEQRAAVESAGADYKPRLYAEGILRQGRQFGGANEGQFTDDSEARVTVEQELHDFGEREATTRAARAEAEAAEVALFDARQRRVLAIRRQFYDLLLKEREVQVWNEAMAVGFVRWDYGQGKEELGQISPVDLARRETRFRRFRGNYREAQLDARLERVRLAHAMGLTDAIPTDLAEPEPDLERQLPNVEELRNRAWQANPRLVEARQRMEAARARVDASQARRWPRITGEVVAQHYARRFNFRNDMEAAIRLEAPLYQGGRLAAQAEEAQARTQQARARWLQLRQTVEENIYQAHLAVQTLREKRQAAETEVAYRQLKTDLARTEYVLELETDLGDALTNQTRAEMKLAEAKYGLAMAFDRLDALVGESLAGKEKM